MVKSVDQVKANQNDANATDNFEDVQRTLPRNCPGILTRRRTNRAQLTLSRQKRYNHMVCLYFQFLSRAPRFIRPLGLSRDFTGECKLRSRSPGSTRRCGVRGDVKFRRHYVRGYPRRVKAVSRLARRRH